MHIVGGLFLVVVGAGIIILGLVAASKSQSGDVASVSCLGTVMVALGVLYLFSDGKPL